MLVIARAVNSSARNAMLLVQDEQPPAIRNVQLHCIAWEHPCAGSSLQTQEFQRSEYELLVQEEQALSREIDAVAERIEEADAAAAARSPPPPAPKPVATPKPAPAK